MEKRRQTSKNSQNSKTLVDRISVLPSPILNHLVSFLPVQDIVRTSVLSKQWRTIWCSVDSFHFAECVFKSEETEFYDFVDSFLFLRDGSNIHKFKLCLASLKDDDFELSTDMIGKWIMYAIRHNVQVLDALFSLGNTEVPPQIFTCQSLKELKLYGATLNLPASIWLPALKSFHLSQSFIRDGRVGKALSSNNMCLLETLIIEDCYFEVPKLLVISIVSLKTLVLKGHLPESVDITTPNLSSLEIGPWPRSDFPITVRFKTGLTNLTYANIQIRATCFEPMTEIFRILQNARSLTLSGLFISSFVEEPQDHLACIKDPFHSLKCLKLGTTFKDREIKVLHTILHHSLLIETIFLENIMGNEEEEDYNEDYKEQDVWFGYEMASLKCVTIQGFRGSLNEVRFVEVVMEKAQVLDKFIILTSKAGDENNQEMTKTRKKLIAFPRASPSVAILFQQIESLSKCCDLFH
ncbi:hypothetical protein ACHQM5_005355 [Ranunculus cassubicifolius]